MIEKAEWSLLMKTLAQSVREYVAAGLSAVTAHVDALDQKIAQIPAGPKGDKGEPGEAIVGPIGPEGKRGIDGISVIGPQGIPGKDGESIVGPAGQAGKDGESVIGPVEPQGIPGQNGKDGESIVGPPGPAGKDADVHELKAYFQSEIAKTLLLLPKDGKDGAPGRDGKDGESIKGDSGKDGESIHPDTIRLMVLDEVNKQVNAVVKPKDGEPGRDALDIDILPAIPEKAVPRGTFAQHKGGLWRARKNTDSPGDWECIVRGLDHVEIEQVDTRTFVVVPILSTGPAVSKAFKMPVLIYRGIYQDGQSYEKGDVVTSGGSAWHCEAETTSLRPGIGVNDWRMMVKEGRKGMDAKSETDPVMPKVSLK